MIWFFSNVLEIRESNLRKVWINSLYKTWIPPGLKKGWFPYSSFSYFSLFNVKIVITGIHEIWIKFFLNSWTKSENMLPETIIYIYLNLKVFIISIPEQTLNASVNFRFLLLKNDINSWFKSLNIFLWIHITSDKIFENL